MCCRKARRAPTATPRSSRRGPGSDRHPAPRGRTSVAGARQREATPTSRRGRIARSSCVKMLRQRVGRAEVEQVLSGPGLVNLHRFTHRGGQCEMLEGVDETEAPARISQAGLSGRCQQCADALRMFVSAYGAEAGNLALRGDGDVRRVCRRRHRTRRFFRPCKTGVFMDAFVAKEPMRELLERVPVKVILNPEAGLIGAASRPRSSGSCMPGKALTRSSAKRAAGRPSRAGGRARGSTASPARCSAAAAR